MRAFVDLREMLMSNADLARKLLALEGKYDAQYGVRGRRWIDCIGRMVMWPSDREVASQFAVVFEARMPSTTSFSQDDCGSRAIA